MRKVPDSRRGDNVGASCDNQSEADADRAEWMDDELTEATKSYWSRMLGRVLTDREAICIMRDFVPFVHSLEDIVRRSGRGS